MRETESEEEPMLLSVVHVPVLRVCHSVLQAFISRESARQ
jgi:hypothetical protein